MTLPEVLRVQEALSVADGGVGWVVTLCSGAGWFAGFVHPSVAEAFFGGDDICIAGSGSVSGVAVEEAGGYRISGAWKYASGAPHATAFTANCSLQRNGNAVLQPDGSPAVSSFIFLREEVSVRETWRSMGMVATASHSFEVHDILIPATRAFTIAPHLALVEDPCYRYPFLQLAETTLAINLGGMAGRFLTLAESMVGSDRRVIEMRRSFEAARQNFFSEADRSWECLLAGTSQPADWTRVSEASHSLVRVCRQALNSVYPLCGLGAANVDTEINRVWRNFHTAGQHMIFRST